MKSSKSTEPTGEEGKAQHLLAVQACDGDWLEYPVGDPDFAAGLEWLRKDADAGNAVSQFQYGEILIWACDIQKTMKAGLDYLKRSAENGYALAAFELGLLHADTVTDWGDVFQADGHEAVRWFERAAELGSVDAVDRLGELLYREAVGAFERIRRRQGSEDDDALVKRVLELTRTAANAGLPCSQMRLAVIYADGMGVARDENEAKRWLYLAERSGSWLADECVDLMVRSGMTFAQAIDSCRDRVS